MKGVGATLALAVAMMLVLPLLMMSSATSTTTTAQQLTASSGTLDASGVPPQYLQYVVQAGQMCADESAPLIAAQIDAESGWNPHAVSPAGAQGIAQFMPGTWATWGKDYDHSGSASPFDPGDAIPSQGALMCALFAQVKTEMSFGAITKGTAEENALAAYNAGLGNVAASRGFPTGIAETDAYVPRIEALKAKYTATAGGSAGGAAAVAAAQKYLGYPYLWGAGDTSGPTGTLWSSGPPVGFDCEGLVRYAIYQGFHVDIGAGTRNQLVTPKLRTISTRMAGQAMPLSQMQAGDVVLINFHPSGDGPWGHVALYIGAGKFIHAPTFGKPVQIVPASHFGSADWTVRRIP